MTPEPRDLIETKSFKKNFTLFIISFVRRYFKF